MVVSNYLKHVFDNNDLRILVDNVSKQCKSIVEDYNVKTGQELCRIGLVGRGLSGALVIPSIALNLNWPFVMVRKRQDFSHSYNEVEGDYNFSHYIFVDDFVSSGHTLACVNDSMLIALPQTKIIGCVLYYTASALASFVNERIFTHIQFADDYHNKSNIDLISDLIIKMVPLNAYS
jgi:phosphoribosylpyrophosphate synthetase